MKSVTLIFPGQGSQYVGMAKNLLEYPESKEILDQAKTSLDFDITELCFNGPAEKLQLTEFTQPAIVTHSVALFVKLSKVLADKNIKIDRVLGHSVGEYSALVAAGALDFSDAIKAVNLRGKFMQEAVAPGIGAMTAILRIPHDIVQKACEAVSTEEEKVMCANFNDPTQVVISGHKEACSRAVAWLKENFEGKQMAIPLKVSAPFHSSLMKPAESKLAAFFADVNFSETKLNYIPNINAKESPAGISAETIKSNLIEQVCGSVLWSQSLASLPDETVFIEVGPGKALTGMNKKINKTFKTYTLDSTESFTGLEDFLQ